MRDLAAEHGILELERELAGRPHPAMGGERAAKHERPVGQASARGMARDQCSGIQHRGDGALLVKRPLAAFDHARAQDQAVPVRRDVIKRPENGRDRFLAHLLGNGDPVFFHLAVGMVGPGADP